MEFVYQMIQTTPRLMDISSEIGATDEIKQIGIKMAKWLQENSPNFQTDTENWNLAVRGSLMSIMQHHMQERNIDFRTLDIDVVWYLNEGQAVICAIFDNVNIEHEDGHEAILYRTNKMILNTLNQNIRVH